MSEIISIKFERKKRRRANDKILDNHYNVGDIETEQLSKNIEVDKSYLKSYCRNEQDTHTYHRRGELEEQINDLFLNTEWHQMYYNKKIPRVHLSEIFNYLRNGITDDSYTEVEIFTQISDYLKVNYKILYESISNSIKIKLLEELNETYEVLTKTKRYKIF